MQGVERVDRELLYAGLASSPLPSDVSGAATNGTTPGPGPSRDHHTTAAPTSPDAGHNEPYQSVGELVQDLKAEETAHHGPVPEHAGLLGPDLHPFAKIYLDQIRENYDKDQKTPFPRSASSFGSRFFDTPLGRAKAAVDTQVADVAQDFHDALAEAQHTAREAVRQLREGNEAISRLKVRAAETLRTAESAEPNTAENIRSMQHHQRANADLANARRRQVALANERSDAQNRAARMEAVLDGSVEVRDHVVGALPPGTAYDNALAETPDLAAQRLTALEKLATARQAADAARDQWWTAKIEVDHRIAEYNAEHTAPRPDAEPELAHMATDPEQSTSDVYRYDGELGVRDVQHHPMLDRDGRVIGPTAAHGSRTRRRCRSRRPRSW